MPQRFLRPGIRKSERWNAVSRNAQVLFIGILTLVDDYGRYEARPSVLCAECFAIWNELNPTLAVNPQETAALIEQLCAADLLMVYESDGKQYLQLTQWQERARGKSKFPEPPQDSAADGCGAPPNPASIDQTTIVPRPSSIDQKNSAGNAPASSAGILGATKSPGGEISPSVKAILNSKELARVEDRIEQIRRGYSAGERWSEADRLEMKRLRDRKSELIQKLGMSV